MLQFCIFYSIELCGFIIQIICRTNEEKFKLKTVGEHKEFLKKTIFCLLVIYYGVVIYILC